MCLIRIITELHLKSRGSTEQGEALNEPQNSNTAGAQSQTAALFGDVDYSSPQTRVAANFHP